MALSRRLRFEILRRDNYTCRYCGASAPDVALEVDHVIPDALGGATEPSNLVTACMGCNRGKTSMPPDAPIVEDVARDALRWSKAVEQAAALQRMERDLVKAQCAEFWKSFKTALDGTQVDVPADWRDSVERFLALGMSVDDLAEHATAVARKVGWSRYQITPDKAWRYFCGRIWKTLSSIHEDAREILESEADAPCG